MVRNFKQCEEKSHYGHKVSCLILKSLPRAIPLVNCSLDLTMFFADCLFHSWLSMKTEGLQLISVEGITPLEHSKFK